MSYTHTRVAESRAYDTVYDPVYTGPFTNTRTDPRVVAAASSQSMVAGQGQYKYFRRPNMPRMSVVAPHVLLAPAVKDIKSSNQEVNQEVATKDVEVQTMYRESEAQTNPYTPEYTLVDGNIPEVMLLKDLTYDNGLPIGRKELEMIAQARAKRETEMNLPPFTDEASLALRRRLMENQEMKEFHLRENELDVKREEKLRLLEEALQTRNESSEFLAAQRIEAIRQLKEEEREKIFEKIRSKRIKVLRRLARQRNEAEPTLSGDVNKDIIDDYFDKGSKAYAPVKRNGAVLPEESENFNVVSRTAPLDNLNNLISLESRIPKKLLTATSGGSSALRIRDLMSKTAPGGSAGVAEERLTSVAQRALRQTKRDIEEMHQILLRKKHASLSLRGAERTDTSQGPHTGATPRAQSSNGRDGRDGRGSGGEEAGKDGENKGLTSFKKAIKRPSTPDLTTDAQGDPVPDTQPFFAAVMLLQRLIRGRAVQNVMYEGRFRRRELIAELRRSDEIHASEVPKSAAQIVTESKVEREKKIKETTIDALTGGVATNFFSMLSEEQARINIFERMQAIANVALADRRKREAAEGGRRQKENVIVS